MTPLRATYSSPFGTLELVSDGTSLTELRFIPDLTSQTSDTDLPQPIAATFLWLDRYFAGHKPDFYPPLKPQGTVFQQRVWHELLNIPYGKTTTYGDIANRIGCRSAQAVGQAVGHNPIAILIPCHRVVGSNGTLTGYAYGLDIKRRLLELEKASTV